MIRAENISVQLPSGKHILDEVSFEIKPGMLTAFLGKNGAGKSTALKAVCGDIPNSTGLTFFEDKDQNSIPLPELAQKRAIVSQKVSLDFSFTVREVVAIGRSPFTGIFHSKRDEEIIRDCLLKVDALHLIDRSYPTLSGGEQQRVQFARALAQLWDSIEKETPSYLILDEPLASLDVAHQHEMMMLLQQLCLHQVGVLIVLHDLNLAAQYADHVLILKHGKTVAEGSPKEIFTDEIISNAFDHPVNVIPHPKIDCPLIIAASRS